jgi:hypothetical protein
MENKIKITKNYRLEYADLMKEVDLSQEFTLRDILNACYNSNATNILTISTILRCPYICDYWDEMNSKPFENNGEIDYLEVYWWGTKQTYKGVREDGNIWSFHGVGKLGYVPEDLLKYGKLTKKEKKNYRQAMAVEFSPMYALADLPIKISKKLHITDCDIKVKSKKDIDSEIDFQPSIKLIELLYAIFWELSFCGSPKQRDNKINDLEKQVDEIKKASKEGRPDEIMVTHEQVKKRILKKIKEINKNAKRT